MEQPEFAVAMVTMTFINCYVNKPQRYVLLLMTSSVAGLASEAQFANLVILYFHCVMFLMNVSLLLLLLIIILYI